MADPAKELIRLAMERFGNLLPGEAKMLRAAAEGVEADVADREGDERLTRESAWGCWEQWGEHRKIRAEVLRWVLMDEEAAGLVHERGLYMFGARIVGAVDLVGARTNRTIAWRCCAIEAGISLQDTHAGVIEIQGSHTGPICGDRLRSGGDIYLRGTLVRGGVRLPSAKIGGSLDCSGSAFENPPGMPGSSGVALNGDLIEVAGSVCLRGMVAKGEVRLPSARIGGSLDCSGSTFENPPGVPGSTGFALHVDRIEVSGSVYLCAGLVAKGEVRLALAKIGGEIVFSGGSFENPPGVHGSSGNAIVAHEIDVRSRVVLFPIEHADARTRLRGSLFMNGGTIGGGFAIQGLDCDGGVCLAGLAAKGALQLDSRTEIKGSFDLRDAHVARLADSADAWGRCARFDLRGFRYASFSDGQKLAVKDRLHWLARGTADADGARRYDAGAFHQLAQVYASMGRGREAVEVRKAQYRAKRAFEKPSKYDRRSLGGWIMWIWRLLVDWLLGCGYDRARPLMYMLGFWLLGVVVFSICENHMVPASDQVLTSPAYIESRALPPDYQPFSPVVYSADAMLPIVELHQERYWLPNAHPKGSGGWYLRWYLWIHIALGWILSTFLAVGVTGLVRNEQSETSGN